MLTAEQLRPALDQRSLEVLRIVVREHVRTGAPVSSRGVARLHPERLSPATIRSLMAELTERGYLEQPHTSAGRVPTDRGYRTFVDGVLAVGRRLAPGEARRIEEMLVSSRQAEEVFARAGRLLGALSKQVAVVVPPDVEAASLEHVDFVRVAPRRMVAVFVARGGVVLHRFVELDEELTQEDLDRAAGRLAEHLEGLTLPEARRRLASSLRADEEFAGRLGRETSALLLRLLESPFPGEEGAVIVDGASRLLDAPEFGDVQRLKDLLRTIEEKSRLVRLLDDCLASPGVTVIIGSEAKDPQLAAAALVASPYRAASERFGLVGVLGPRRMEYARAVALVDHVARTLSALLDENGRPRPREES
ncbi:MAG: heat-inducible transcriptional repressor HrcA [Candidatus Polarisedimenticolia bacterium]